MPALFHALLHVATAVAAPLDCADPDALTEAALSTHEQAVSTRDPADFSAAADQYGDLLAACPDVPDRERLQWYQADVLHQARQYAEAADVYRALIEAEGPYAALARYRLTLTLRQQLTSRYGPVSRRPDEALIEGSEVLPSGAERPIYRIGIAHRRYVESVDALLAIDFDAAQARAAALAEEAEDPHTHERHRLHAEELAQVAEVMLQSHGPMLFETAQVVHRHGHLDAARERLFAVVEGWPERDFAAHAVQLIMEGLLEQEDYARVRELRWLLEVGPSEEPAPTELVVSASFKMAQALADEARLRQRAGDAAGMRDLYLQAAEAYLSLIAEHPDEVELAKMALYSAGYSFELAGERQRASDCFAQYVDRYPTDELSWPLTFRIAANHAASMQLEEAVRYFELLYQNAGPEYQDAPSALYNAAFLRIGLGDNEGAARGFEQYAQVYPDMSDAEAVMFLAGPRWEQVDSREALRFYRRYLAHHPDTDPERAMTAHARIAVLLEESGRPEREVERAWGAIATFYEVYASHIGPEGRHLAATGVLRQLERDVADFQAQSLDVRSLKDDIYAKGEVLQAIEERSLALIRDFADFETASAARHLAGVSWLALVDMVEAAPASLPLGEDEVDLTRLLLNDWLIVLESKARDRLKSNLTLAAQARRWSVWQSRSLAELARRFPREFVDARPEIRGGVESLAVKSAGPVQVRRKPRLE